MIAVQYDAHPNEPTGRLVAAALMSRPIKGMDLIQGNYLAAKADPPLRFVNEELTGAFGKERDGGYERDRAAYLAQYYRGFSHVIDIHNNATMPTKYGMIGPWSHRANLRIAAFLGISNIVILSKREWPGYEYYDINPNLITIEGREDNPNYTADWWYDRLSHLAALERAHQVHTVPIDGIRFFRRLPDITWKLASDCGFHHYSHEPSFDTPLPEWIARKIAPSNSSNLYALSWPTDNGRVGYAPPELDYFGEVVAELRHEYPGYPKVD